MATAKAKTKATSVAPKSLFKDGKFYVAKEELSYIDTRGEAKPFTCVIRLKSGDQVKLRSIDEIVYL